MSAGEYGHIMGITATRRSPLPSPTRPLQFTAKKLPPGAQGMSPPPVLAEDRCAHGSQPAAYQSSSRALTSSARASPFCPTPSEYSPRFGHDGALGCCVDEL